jgi:GTP cyclohydrolase FolE2
MWRGSRRPHASGDRFRPDRQGHGDNALPLFEAIAAYGAHNQRGEVTVRIRFRKVVWIEDLIEIIEARPAPSSTRC